MSKTTYREAGVDIDAGESLVDWIKALPRGQFSQNVLGGVGGFAALYSLKDHAMEEPILVSATDGVGTKLKLAIELDKYDTIGQDLVAMCVNDLICTGGRPLFFLDYLSVGKLQLERAKDFVGGVHKACEASECALIGGETAEMPGMYAGDDFDCAGFAIGLVDRKDILGPARVSAGQTVLALASSGFHSNGYSLIRKIYQGADRKFKQELLTPTRLYVDAFGLLQKSGQLHALAHVTGGGLRNLLRVIPKNTSVELTPWPISELFLDIQKKAELTRQELFETFNCGVGLFAIVDGPCDGLISDLERLGHSAWVAGRVIDAGDNASTVRWTDS